MIPENKSKIYCLYDIEDGFFRRIVLKNHFTNGEFTLDKQKQTLYI